MKRITTNLSDRQYKAMKPLLEPGHGGLAKFVREAIQEKVDRDLVLEHVERMQGDLDDLLMELRAEKGKMLGALMESNKREVNRMRDDLTTSLRKNEEMQKAFLLRLAGALINKPAVTQPGPSEPPG